MFVSPFGSNCMLGQDRQDNVSGRLKAACVGDETLKCQLGNIIHLRKRDGNTQVHMVAVSALLPFRRVSKYRNMHIMKCFEKPYIICSKWLNFRVSFTVMNFHHHHSSACEKHQNSQVTNHRPEFHNMWNFHLCSLSLLSSSPQSPAPPLLVTCFPFSDS